jgi:hypothetical protein
MVDYQAVKAHFENGNPFYYIFYPKSQTPIKAMIRHLPQNAPAEGMSDWLVHLGFSVVSVK